MSISNSVGTAQTEQNVVIQVLTELRQERRLNSQFPQTTRRKRLENYGLTAEQITPELQQQLNEFYAWMTVSDPRFSQQQALVKPKTAMVRLEEVHRLLGWLLHHKGISLEALNLTQLVTFVPIKTAYRGATSFEAARQIEQAAEEAAERTLMILNEHLSWRKEERGACAASRRLVIDCFIALAKFLYRSETNCLKGQPYYDVPAIVALRKANRDAKELVKHEPKAIDTSLKWLPWEEYLEMVRHLKQECQLHYSHGKRRTPRAIAKSVRRYLICAFFAYMPPDRQQTYRKLQIGKTLVKGVFGADGFFKPDEAGQWHIWLPAEGYKTGKTYGDQWRQMPEILYPDIEAWLNEWRAVFNPQHDFFFTQEDGQPFTDASSFSGVIKHAAARITGKQLTSHLIRHMLVTFAQEHGASEATMHSLAEAMLHSKETQEKVYDQRSKLDRIAPAQQFVLDLAMGRNPSTMRRDKLSVEDLKHAIGQLSPQDYARLMRSLKPSSRQ
jgi:hypothetical protein